MEQDADLAHDVRPLVRRLGKPPETWQRQDLLELCLEDQIRVVNFRYASFDGKLRELRLPVRGREHLEKLLATGERVDGSSLFPGLFGTEASDLYAVPVYRWAFLDPWADDELHVVCRFANRFGQPSPLVPDRVLAGAAERLRETTGFGLEALAELEFYLLLEREDERFTGRFQRNYHQSAPYVHGRGIADEILRTASETLGAVKYCHSEVGYIDQLESEDPELDGRRVEQFELELDLVPIEDLGTWLAVARWLIRAIAARHGASATFVPKLDEGMAGSGMHLHLALTRDGRNAMHDGEGQLTDEAVAMIGGLLGRAQPLAAFGNTVASSYFRLVPGQEAPTRICWGKANRAALVRVPLSFATPERLDLAMNPGEKGPYPADVARPTVEYRGPDGSAYSHLLLAGMTMAAEEGLAGGAGLERGRKLELGHGNSEDRRDYERLPATAVEAAARLHEERVFFEDRGFSFRLIDLVIAKLEKERDADLARDLAALPAAERLALSRRLMHKDLHKH